MLTGINGPTSILFDGDDVYTSHVGGTITRRDASDFTSNQVTIATGLVTPVLMVRINNDLYFVQNGSGVLSRFQGDVLSITDKIVTNTITVFPNPNQGQFSIQGLEGKTVNDIAIIDVTGRICKAIKNINVSKI